MFYSQLLTVCNHFNGIRLKASAHAVLTRLLNLPKGAFCNVSKKNFCFICWVLCACIHSVFSPPYKFDREFYAKSPNFLFALEFRRLL